MGLVRLKALRGLVLILVAENEATLNLDFALFFDVTKATLYKH